MADVETGWSQWPAPAKLNLFLRIVGRRADGYHLLQTVFQLLDWGDRIDLRTRGDGCVERLAGPDAVAPDDDLAVRAARALQRATGIGLGADIRVSKQIPLGGGFGGGSSDAATVLVALNQLWDAGLGQGELERLGLGLGADVPLFVRGHSAWAEGVGDVLTPLRLPPRHYLLLDPGVHVPTGELFQAPDLTRNGPPITIADFVDDAGLGNVFEPVLRARSERVDQAMNALSKVGRARLTGTGSGCFVAFESIKAAEAARSALDQTWDVWTALGVSESPLLAAVREHQARRS